MNGSADINDIISKLTQNPDMMKNLMGVAKNLMNNGEKPNDSAPVFSEGHSEKRYIHEQNNECRSCEEKEPNHRKRGDDAENLIRLLLALRPFVSPERCAKIDNIVKILKLVQLSEKTGLLKSLL